MKLRDYDVEAAVASLASARTDEPTAGLSVSDRNIGDLSAGSLLRADSLAGCCKAVSELKNLNGFMADMIHFETFGAPNCRHDRMLTPSNLAQLPTAYLSSC